MKKINHFTLPYAVLSWIQAKELLQAKANGLERVITSLDLGLSRQEVRLDPVGIATDKEPLIT